MKATLKLEINKKIIELTLVEVLELREQLNALVGLSEKKYDDLKIDPNTWRINYPTITVDDTGGSSPRTPFIYTTTTSAVNDGYSLLTSEENS